MSQELAIYIFKNPDEQGSHIWIYRRDGYYLIQCGHDNDRRITNSVIRNRNHLEDFISGIRQNQSYVREH
jgi:hypothetical protein